MKIKTRDMILISMFAALTAIGAFIKIPTPIVPFTLQFLFCAYSGIFLGSKHGLYSQLLYVSIGLIGIPIFASGGGPAYVLQPTFGYLIGFIICAFVIGKLTENIEKVSLIKILIPVLIGLLFVYLFGVTYLYMILTVYMKKEISMAKAIAIGFSPYIASDLIISFFVAATAVYVVPALRKAGFRKLNY